MSDYPPYSMASSDENGDQEMDSEAHQGQPASDPASYDDFNDQLVPMQVRENAYSTQERLDDEDPSVINPELAEQLEMVVANPHALRDFVRREIMHKNNQPERASIIMSIIMRELGRRGLFDSFQLFYPLWCTQGFLWDHHLKTRRRQYPHVELTRLEMYRFPESLRKAFNHSFRNGHLAIAERVVQCFLNPSFGRNTDSIDQQPKGSTREVYLKTALKAAVRKDSSELPALMDESLPIDTLKQAFEVAMEKQHWGWMKLLVDNLAREKPEDEERTAERLNVPQSDPRVREGVSRLRGLALKDSLGDALKTPREEAIPILLPPFMRFIAGDSRSRQNDLDEFLDPVTDNMYHLIPRGECLDLVKTGNIPPVTKARILSRLRYDYTRPAEYILKTANCQFPVARDILCLWSEYFADKDRTGWGNDHESYQLDPEFSAAVVSDAVRFMYRGGWLSLALEQSSYDILREHVAQSIRFGSRYRMQELVADLYGIQAELNSIDPDAPDSEEEIDLLEDEQETEGLVYDEQGDLDMEQPESLI
ncbi:hypothetical protein BJY04DRAFT_217368 [Aspergillus karnatakaensis]|uniref:BTB/POZ domain-containing protein n=1 Tax=Aspergillus karnatakaensis TaxID=1810916 RepID=UPI003CCE51CB